MALLYVSRTKRPPVRTCQQRILAVATDDRGKDANS